MPSVTDAVSAQLEVVDKKVQDYIDKSSQIYSLIKRAGGDDPITVSRYLYRVPFKRYRAGVFGKYNNDGGAYLTGNSPAISHFTAGYFTFDLAYKLTQEQIDTMNTSAQARTNILTDVTGDAIEEMGVYLDTALHTDGTGKLTASASSSPGATQLIFASASDNVGVDRLRPGMTVDVWDTNGQNKKAGGPYFISNIDRATKTVTFSGNVTGIAATDLLSFYNVDVYGPSVTLTSFSSSWPGEALTSGAGLTGDSFVHGIPYANDATVSNYYLGKLKSSYGELKPINVAAGTAALVFQHGLLAVHGLQHQRGSDVHKDMVGIFPLAQQAQVFNIGFAISNWDRRSGDKSLDLMPSNIDYTKTFEFCGITCYPSIRQDASRVDFIIPKNWRRVQTADIGFLKNEAGGYLHDCYTNPSSTTVSKAAAKEIHVVGKMDFACMDPGAGAYISGLTKPTGY